jgi:hypothetical protein
MASTKERSRAGVRVIARSSGAPRVIVATRLSLEKERMTVPFILIRVRTSFRLKSPEKA